MEVLSHARGYARGRFRYGVRDLDDVMQDVAETAWRIRHQLGDDASISDVRGWVFTITKRACLKQINREQREVLGNDGDAAEWGGSAVNANAEDALLSKELLTWATSNQNVLAVWYVALHGLEDASRLLKVTKGALSSRLQRGRDAIAAATDTSRVTLRLRALLETAS